MFSQDIPDKSNSSPPFPIYSCIRIVCDYYKATQRPLSFLWTHCYFYPVTQIYHIFPCLYSPCSSYWLVLPFLPTKNYYQLCISLFCCYLPWLNSSKLYLKLNSFNTLTITHNCCSFSFLFTVESVLAKSINLHMLKPVWILLALISSTRENWKTYVLLATLIYGTPSLLHFLLKAFLPNYPGVVTSPYWLNSLLSME